MGNLSEHCIVIACLARIYEGCDKWNEAEDCWLALRDCAIRLMHSTDHPLVTQYQHNANLARKEAGRLGLN